jgi:hypothetical protein
MNCDVRLLDPRHDPAPPYWETWRRRAGLRANWAWPLVRAGAWTSRAPLLLAVLHRASPVDNADSVVGVVAASVQGARLRRRRFCSESGWPRVGLLQVHAPQSSAQQGWWFDTEDPAERAALFRTYTRAVRLELGTRVLGALWRQVGEDDLALLPRRVMVRPTVPVAILDTPFASADSWLRKLRRSRRHDIRRICRSLAADPDLDIQVGAAADLADLAELVHLARLNHDKHGAATADRYSGLGALAWQQAAAHRSDITTVAYRNGSGRLLGAGVILDDDRRPLWLSWGAEPIDQGGRRNLYFDMYSRMVQLMVTQGKDGIVLGKGMAELKVDLGARLVPQYAVVTRVG